MSREPPSELEPQIHLRPLSSKYRVLGAIVVKGEFFTDGSGHGGGVEFSEFSFWVIGLYLVILFVLFARFPFFESKFWILDRTIPGTLFRCFHE